MVRRADKRSCSQLLFLLTCAGIFLLAESTYAELTFGPRFSTRRRPSVRTSRGRSCRGFSCLSRRSSSSGGRVGGGSYGGGGQVIRNAGGGNNNKNVFDLDDFDNIAPYARLAENNDVLFERNAVGRIVAQLFIDRRTGLLSRQFVRVFRRGRGRFGRAFVARVGRRFLVGRNEKTTEHLTGFYNRNREKFVDAVRDADNRNDRIKALQNLQLVDSFLARFGRKTRGGQFALNLRDTTMDESLIKLAGGGEAGRQKVATATTNFLINLLSSRSRNLFRIEDQGGYRDIARMNLRRFFNDQKLSRLLNGNPYACGRNIAPSLDWFAANAMDPEIYKETIGAGDDYEFFGQKYGIDNIADRLSPRARGRTGGTILTRGQPYESGVVFGAYRVRMYERQRDGQICWNTADESELRSESTATESGDPTKTHIDALTFDARETICKNPNGYPAFGLFAFNGGRVNSAPIEIAGNQGNKDIDAHSAEGTGVGVSTPVGCLRCHARGMIWGNQYKTDARQLPRRLGSAAYANPKSYEQAVNIDNDRWKRTVFASKADINGRVEAVVPKAVAKYKKALTIAELAKELGTDEAGVRRVVSPFFITRRKGVEVVTRDDVEGQFCDWKRALGLAGTGRFRGRGNVPANNGGGAGGGTGGVPRQQTTSGGQHAG